MRRAAPGKNRNKRKTGWALLLAGTLLLAGCRERQPPAPALSWTSPASISSSEPACGVSFLMNTFVEQKWYGENARTCLDEITARLGELEQQLSLYLEESEVSKINRAAGKEPVAVSEGTYGLLKRAVSFCELSGGQFDITVAPLTLAWGITSQDPHVPAGEDIEAAKALVDYRKIRFDDENRTVMLEEAGMSIDLGGIAKGMAAGLVSEIPERYGVSGYLSIGGNLMVRGAKPDGSAFLFGIRDPRGSASEYLAVVELDGYTMATTGGYERYFEENGVRYHHVIDPFTGYPADTDLTSVTVISRDGTLADAMSTILFMKGSDEIIEYLDSEEYWVIAVDRDQNVVTSPGVRPRLTPAGGGYHFNGL